MSLYSSTKSVIKNSVYHFMSPILRPLYGGIGSILILHRITEDSERLRIDLCRNLLEVSPRWLEGTIEHLRKKQYAFVSMDEVYDILRKNKKVQKFIAVTIDDGYCDTYTNAFPMLTAERIPFTLYLTTGIPDKVVIPWTYLLERRLCREQSIAFDFDGIHHEYRLRDKVERESAFWALRDVFEKLSVADIGRLSRHLFGEEEIQCTIDELSVSWEEVEEMSQHPLVTIGVHTINHQCLKSVDRKTAREELLGAKKAIESRLDTRVRHCSYPYGTEACCGAREFELAKECGFDTASTTRPANLFPEHINGLHSLPRISGVNINDLDMALSGTVSAFRFRGRRVIM